MNQGLWCDRCMENCPNRCRSVCRVPGILDAAVGNIERLAPGNFQNASRLRRFASAVFGGTARSHFTLCKVEDAGAVSALGHLVQSSATGLFYIIAVRGEGQNVEGHW